MPTSLELKYVIIDGAMPIIFISQQHQDMKVHGDITSSAFFKIKGNTVETYGRSHSLDMGPSENDARILEHFLGLS